MVNAAVEGKSRPIRPAVVLLTKMIKTCSPIIKRKTRKRAGPASTIRWVELDTALRIIMSTMLWLKIEMALENDIILDFNHGRKS